jgi:hypothetical protein
VNTGPSIRAPGPRSPASCPSPAGHAIPEAPRSSRDDLRRRLALPLGPGLLGPAAGAVAAGTAATVGAGVVATKASALARTLLVVAIAGAGIYAARHASPPGPTAAAPANHDHSSPGATTAPRPPIDSSMTAHATLDAPSAPLAPSAALPLDADRNLLETARAHIDSGDAPGALELPVDFHSFRRAFSTALADTGLNTQQAMKLAGHADPRAHARYIMEKEKPRSIPEAALPRLARGDVAMSIATASKGGSKSLND